MPRDTSADKPGGVFFRGPNLFLGLDPGVLGGLARIDRNFGVSAVPMPVTEVDVWEWFSRWAGSTEVFAVVEKVGGFVAGNPTPGSAMFKFGRNVGLLVGCLVAAGIPFEEVTPQKWQKEFALKRTPAETKRQYKNRAKGIAQKLFPGSDVTLPTADAILIAEYARRKYG